MLKRNLKKIPVALASAAMMASMCFPAFAATTNGAFGVSDSAEDVTYYDDDDYTSAYEADESQTTEVEVLQGASFSVTIPKLITLDGARDAAANDADYTVTVTANIPGDVSIDVVPEDSLTMSEKGGVKADLTATVTPGDTQWTIEEDGVDDMIDAVAHDGNNVAVADLSAGEWSGTFDFTISVNDIATP